MTQRIGEKGLSFMVVKNGRTAHLLLTTVSLFFHIVGPVDYPVLNHTKTIHAASDDGKPAVSHVTVLSRNKDKDVSLVKVSTTLHWNYKREEVS